MCRSHVQCFLVIIIFYHYLCKQKDQVLFTHKSMLAWREKVKVFSGKKIKEGSIKSQGNILLRFLIWSASIGLVSKNWRKPHSYVWLHLAFPFSWVFHMNRVMSVLCWLSVPYVFIANSPGSFLSWWAELPAGVSTQSPQQGLHSFLVSSHCNNWQCPGVLGGAAQRCQRRVWVRRIALSLLYMLHLLDEKCRLFVIGNQEGECRGKRIYFLKIVLLQYSVAHL